MPLKVALQMDPPSGIDVHKDTSFLLGLEAQKRGYTLFYYNADTLKLHNGVLSASCAPLKFYRNEKNHFDLGDFKDTDLTTLDIILMRNDFNDPLSYNAMTHVLDHLEGKTLVLNSPKGVRESPEKMLITHFPDLAPPTLITRNLDDIRAFQKQYADLIIKPLNGFGGAGIYHISPQDDNLSSVHEMLCLLYQEPFVVQKYLPEIKDGDKRIIVVEGKPIAAFTRIAAKGSARANLAAGGHGIATEISEREREICKILKPELIKRGLVFVGLDVIGGHVTEINPKSPTGLQQIYALSGIKCEEAIWDAYEERYEQFKN